MKSRRKQVRLALLMSLILLCPYLTAQTNALQGSSATPSPASETQDKSGTNPLVLRYTGQIFSEYYNLPGEGLNNNITKFRFVVPFAKKRASVKLDLPINATNTSIGFLSGGTDGPLGLPPIGVVPGDTKVGFGDLNLKFTYVPYFSRKLKLGLVTSLEFGFDTASRPVLGSGRNTIAPTPVVVTFPMKNTIFAPSYKQPNSYSGAANRGNINQGTRRLVFPSVEIGPTTSRSRRELKRFGDVMTCVHSLTKPIRDASCGFVDQVLFTGKTRSTKPHETT